MMASSSEIGVRKGERNSKQSPKNSSRAIGSPTVQQPCLGEAYNPSLNATSSPLDILVANKIQPSLSDHQWTAQKNGYGTYISSVREFCEKHLIRQDFPLQNHLWLARGLPNIPCILLQNPTQTHRMAFHDMVDNTQTLSYLQKTLGEIGLTLDEVSILDAIPLLTDEDLRQMEPEARQQAVREAFELTGRFIRIFQPSVIVSLQCVTRHNERYSGAPPLATKLASSVRAAKNGEVKLISVGGRDVHIVQGFHPNYVLRKADPDEKTRRQNTLQKILGKVYRPCSAWRRTEDEFAREKLGESREHLEQAIKKFLAVKQPLTALQRADALQTQISDRASDKLEHQVQSVTKENFSEANIVVPLITSKCETTSELTKADRPEARYWKAQLSFTYSTFEAFHSDTLRISNVLIPYMSNANYGERFIYLSLPGFMEAQFAAAGKTRRPTVTGENNLLPDANRWWKIANQVDGKIGVFDTEFRPKSLPRIFAATASGVALNVIIKIYVESSTDDRSSLGATALQKVVVELVRGYIVSINVDVKPPAELARGKPKEDRSDIAADNLTKEVAALEL